MFFGGFFVIEVLFGLIYAKHLDYNLLGFFFSVFISFDYTMCVGVGLSFWRFNCYLYFYFIFCRRLWIEEEKHVLSQLQDIGQVCKYGFCFILVLLPSSQYLEKLFYSVHTYQIHKIKHRRNHFLNIVKFIENLFLINE